MAQQIGALKKLELALLETQQAIGGVIQVIRKTSETSPLSHQKLSRDDTVSRIIPHYVFDTYRERRQRGEELDRRYTELLLREQKLKSEYLDPDNADRHDTLLAQLEAVQQEMTQILLEFDPPDIEA